MACGPWACRLSALQTLPLCYAELQLFAVLPSNPAFVHLTCIQRLLLSHSEEQIRAPMACATVWIAGSGEEWGALVRRIQPCCRSVEQLMRLPLLEEIGC